MKTYMLFALTGSTPMTGHREQLFRGTYDECRAEQAQLAPHLRGPGAPGPMRLAIGRCGTRSEHLAECARIGIVPSHV